MSITKALRNQHLDYVAEHPFAGQPEQCFRLHVDALDPAICIHHHHRVRRMLVDLFEQRSTLAQRFLRGSLDTMREQALAAIKETVDKSIAEINAR